MSKKTLIKLLLLFVFCLNAKAQNKTICGEVYYKQATNFSRYFVRQFIMQFNNDASLYQEYNLEIEKGKLKKNYSNQGLTYVNEMARKNLSPEFFYSNKEDLYFREIWFDKSLLVKEPKLTFTWILQSDTRKIGKFICQKAITTFRGRDYIAWFTKDIPVPFGPWKFKNLPGLILEIYDTEDIFHIMVQKIKIDRKINCKLNITVKDLQNPLSLKEYFKERKNLINADFARLSSKMGRTKPLKMDENCNDCSESIEIFNKNN
jgi:GLPGLI family protein